MTSFLPPSLLATATPLPNAPPLSTRSTVANTENSFSRQLEQSRQTRAQEKPRPTPADKPAAPLPSPSPAPAPAQKSATPANRPPAKPEAGARNESARTARAAPSRERGAPTNADSARPEVDADPKADAESDLADTADATASDPLALLGLASQTPVPPVPASLPADGGAAVPPGAFAPLAAGAQPGLPATPAAADAAAADSATLGVAATSSQGAAPTDALHLQAAAEPRDAREPGRTTAVDAGAWQQAQAAAALAEGSGALRDTIDGRHSEPTAGSDRALAGVGLSGLSGPSGPGGHTAKAGDVPVVNLATPATSPEFRAALGAQVSYFARAGVQQAELHLNPADMGPVSIQITVDGQQAQVNFGADSALTRQIIESGMPELAGALRDAGLTLTGGGVSQHAGGQRQDGNGGGSPGGSASNVNSGTSTDTAGEAQVEQTRRSLARSSSGGVDLYA